MAEVVDFVDSLICVSHVLFFIAVATTAALVAITPGTGAKGEGIVALVFFSMIGLLGVIVFVNSLIKHVPSMLDMALIFSIVTELISLPIFLEVTAVVTHTALLSGFTLAQVVLGSIAYAMWTAGFTLYAIIVYTCHKHRCSTWELINKPRVIEHG